MGVFEDSTSSCALLSHMDILDGETCSGPHSISNCFELLSHPPDGPPCNTAAYFPCSDLRYLLGHCFPWQNELFFAWGEELFFKGLFSDEKFYGPPFLSMCPIRSYGHHAWGWEGGVSPAWEPHWKANAKTVSMHGNLSSPVEHFTL